MHPNKFFNEVALRTGIDTFEIFDDDLKDRLKNLHPMNFVKTKITLPVYKVLIGYETSNCNYKESEKYMVMDYPSDESESYDDFWADMLCRDYADIHRLKNVKILEISHVCDAVLPIG